MSRKFRIWYPGATYHTYARGNRREALFREDCDYLRYLNILEDVRSRHPFVLHSYCLMTNHLHLLIETIITPISLIMKEMHSRYAVYYNHKSAMDGHVFQGRYGAKVIESVDYFLAVSRYIHRNPIEANVVRDMADYSWSSYSSFVQLQNNPHIDPTRTFSYFNEPVNEQYQLFAESESKEELLWVPR